MQLIKYIFYLLYKLISRRKILKVTVQIYIFVSKDMRNDFLFQVLFWTLYIKWLILVVYIKIDIYKRLLFYYTRNYLRPNNYNLFSVNVIGFSLRRLYYYYCYYWFRYQLNIFDWHIYVLLRTMLCQIWCKTNKIIDTTMVVVRG